MVEIHYKIFLKNAKYDRYPEVLYTSESEDISMVEIYTTYKRAYPRKVIEIEKLVAAEAE